MKNKILWSRDKQEALQTVVAGIEIHDIFAEDSIRETRRSGRWQDFWHGIKVKRALPFKSYEGAIRKDPISLAYESALPWALVGTFKDLRLKDDARWFRYIETDDSEYFGRYFNSNKLLSGQTRIDDYFTVGIAPSNVDGLDIVARCVVVEKRDSNGYNSEVFNYLLSLEEPSKTDEIRVEEVAGPKSLSKILLSRLDIMTLGRYREKTRLLPYNKSLADVHFSVIHSVDRSEYCFPRVAFAEGQEELSKLLYEKMKSSIVEYSRGAKGYAGRDLFVDKLPIILYN